MNEPHITPQDADLYALGTLDARERERCDAHAATCGACAKLLGDAESVIEALEVRAGSIAAPASLRFARRRPRAWMMTAGLCASLVAAALLLARVLTLSASVQSNDVAMLALIHSHFNHSPFVALKAGAPAAKVMYAQDGAWLYIVVDIRSQPLAIDGFDRAGHRSELGRFNKGDTPVSTFIRPTQRIVRIVLADGFGSTVASAQLAYPRLKN